jgi:hypothetical protein
VGAPRRLGVLTRSSWPGRRGLLARQRLEDLPVMQVSHEVAAVANIQGGVGDSRREAVRLGVL